MRFGSRGPGGPGIRHGNQLTVKAWLSIIKDGSILFFQIDTIPSTILTFFFDIDTDIKYHIKDHKRFTFMISSTFLIVQRCNYSTLR